MRIRIVALTACFCIALGCSMEHTAVSPSHPSQADARYSTSFPGPEGAARLEQVLPSVRLLSSVGYYRQAHFDAPTDWPVDRPLTDRIWLEADTVVTFTESVVGTGTVLQFSSSRVALLTSAHVVTFGDTVKTFHRLGGDTVGLRDIAVKVRQRNYLVEVDGADQLEVLARDDRLDIAIVGQAIDSRDVKVPALPLPAGRADRLAWGSFVYVVGFPVGLRMVSSGIVSQPERDRDASFLINVVFNRGMSGAPIFAARQGGSSLEWVGIATSGSAATEYVLVPDEHTVRKGVVSGESYEGDVLIDRAQRVRYGVTMGVSIEAIQKLARDNHASLIRKGYRLSILN